MKEKDMMAIDRVLRARGASLPIDDLADAAGSVSPEEAVRILSRFVASHFRRTDREHARISIPADPTRDDDLRMSVFIRDAAACIRALDAQREALGTTGDRGLLLFGQNYYTIGDPSDGFPVVGCGLIGVDRDHGDDVVLVFRTEHGETIQRSHRFIFVDRENADALRAEIAKKSGGVA